MALRRNFSDKQSIANAINEGKIYAMPLTVKAKIMRLFLYNPYISFRNKDLVKETGCTTALANLYLHKLMESNFIKRIGHGQYTINEEHVPNDENRDK